MIVYRVERRSDGAGPYRAGSSGGLATLSGESTDLHPSPWSEAEMCTPLSCEDWPRDSLFGFTSEKQARDWFGDPFVVDEMEEKGFAVGIYMAERTSVWQGRKQCVFDPDHARRIEELPPTWLLD